MDVKTLADLPPWEWPRDAHDVILAALRGDGSPAERLLAAELAGSIVVMDDPMAEALVDLVRSPDDPPELRATAAISLGPVLEEIDLGLLDDPEGDTITPPVARAIRKGLRDVYMDPGVPEAVRRRVLEASVRCVEGWHPAAVRAAYHTGDREWRRTAVFCMGWVAGFDAEVVETLEDADPELRFEAVRAAGRCGADGAWSHICAILRDPYADRDLLLEAIDAVVGIRPEEAEEVLGELTYCGVEEVEEAVWDALALAGVDLDEPDDL